MDLVYNEIKKFDNSKLIHKITRTSHKLLINSDAGKEHYKLLAYLSTKVNNGLILELGTHNGTSSTALATNPSNKIITYDIVDRFSAIPSENVDRRIGNIFDLKQESILLDADFIFLDTAHLGDFELQVYEYLRDNNYKGFIVYDDIHWSKGMINFWNKIPNNIKYDITEIGHSVGMGPLGNISGTGLIDFSGKINLVK